MHLQAARPAQINKSILCNTRQTNLRRSSCKAYAINFRYLWEYKISAGQNAAQHITFTSENNKQPWQDNVQLEEENLLQSRTSQEVQSHLQGLAALLPAQEPVTTTITTRKITTTRILSARKNPTSRTNRILKNVLVSSQKDCMAIIKRFLTRYLALLRRRTFHVAETTVSYTRYSEILPDIFLLIYKLLSSLARSEAEEAMKA